MGFANVMMSIISFYLIICVIHVQMDANNVIVILIVQNVNQAWDMFYKMGIVNAQTDYLIRENNVLNV